MRRQDNRPAGTRVDRQAGLGLQVVSCGIRKQQQQQQIRRKVGEPVVGVAQQDDGLACGRMKHTHTRTHEVDGCGRRVFESLQREMSKAGRGHYWWGVSCGRKQNPDEKKVP